VNSSPLSSWKILLTGITSIHGWPIYNKLKSVFREDQLYCIRPPQTKTPAGKNIIAACMTDIATFIKIKDTFHPTHVLHMAGVCDLDKCEEDPEKAYAINTLGSNNIVDVFGGSSYIMYLSADLVFSGYHPPSNGYDETHEPCPVSVVGKTYLAAEREMLRASHASMVRIGLPMGDSVRGEKGAIDFIERRFKRGLPMTLFYDEWRSCIHCNELADIVADIFTREETGLYHCGGPRPVSLYEIGEWILRRGDYNPKLLKKSSRLEEVNGPPRIGNVHLNSGKIQKSLNKTISAWPQ
jgi:dTDP-4-dehydrorhamnose reductase